MRTERIDELKSLAVDRQDDRLMEAVMEIERLQSELEAKMRKCDNQRSIKEAEKKILLQEIVDHAECKALCGEDE